MELKGRTVIVTGAAAGIGRALAQRFGALGAALIVVSDIDQAGAARVAESITKQGGTALAMRADVADEADVQALVAAAVEATGRIDLFCSNAGVIVQGGPEAPDAEWSRALSINLLSHVYASRAALPIMLRQGEGYLLNNCSAAGLLTSMGAAPYAVSKHAAVGFAEWLAITYGDRGIRVSALCSQAVRTDMLAGAATGDAGAAVKSGGRIIEPDNVATQVVEALADERFMIFTHEETEQYFQRKAGNYDKWISGMRKYSA